MNYDYDSCFGRKRFLATGNFDLAISEIAVAPGQFYLLVQLLVVWLQLNPCYIETHQLILLNL